MYIIPFIISCLFMSFIFAFEIGGYKIEHRCRDANAFADTNSRYGERNVTIAEIASFHLR